MSEFEMFIYGMIAGAVLLYVMVAVIVTLRNRAVARAQSKQRWHETERMRSAVSHGHEVYVDERIKTPEWMKR